MDDRYEAFLAADPLFFDVLHAKGAETFRHREPAPGWQYHEQDDWLVFRRPGAVLPAQGWKIHVSSCLVNAERILDQVWDYCVPRGIEFKYLRSLGALLGRISKYAARGYSGKLVTIYPESEAACELILTELGALLEGEPHPYILSDLRWGSGPLFVRYGAFAGRYCVADNGQTVGAIEDDTGRLVPDKRDPVFYIPPWVELPAFLRPHLDARNSVTVESLPYRIDRVLHFSNGGGIYVDDAQGVVLKEARPHAGVDSRGDDAVARLEREHEMLQRFAGISGIPKAFGMFDVGEHRFLAMEHIDGQSLSREIVRRCPLIRLDGDPAEFAGWAMNVYAQVETAIHQIHERGYVYGDLHLWNVMVRDDGSIALLDFEVAAPADEARRPGLANQGFAAPRGTRGFDIDRYALACLRLALFLPMTNILWLDRGKAVHLAAVIRDHFPVPQEFLDRALEVIAPSGGRCYRTDRWPAIRDELATAIVASATPDREDRLFPGDIRQFGPGGGINLAHGASGVLYALSATGAGRFPEFERWLLRKAERPAGGTPLGFYDGLHGVAFALHHLGYVEEAMNLIDLCLHEAWPALGLDLHSGLAGVGLNLLHLADNTGEPALRLAGLEAARLVFDQLGDEDSVPETSGRDNPYAGLMRGASGPALLLMRAYDETRDEELLDRAATALRMDLKRCVVRDDGMLEVNEGWRTMPYLDVGSVGIGLALDAYLSRRPDERFQTAAEQARLAAQSEMYIFPGLFSGRAGILMYLAQRDGGREDPGMAKQVRNLAWHALSFSGGVAFPGSTLMRLSMDLATGTAGVLLALGAALHDHPVSLPLMAQRAPTPSGVG